jgi:uncharacterized protein (PEP-CTERM system associated)
MLFKYYLRYWFYLLLIFFIYQRSLFAKDLLFTPSLTASQIFSDNFNLSGVDKKSAFITEMSPGISVRKQANWLNLNLDYKLQNLFNLSTGNSSLFHMLQMNSKFQLANNSLFLETRASNTQQSISTNSISNSNAIGALNRTNTTSYGFSPHWTPHFNGYAVGDIRYNYDVVNTGTSAVQNVIRTEEIVNIASDQRFSYNVMWRLAHSNRDYKSANGSGIRFQDDEAEARIKIHKDISMFSLVGYSDTDFEVNKFYKNGGYYTAGLRWQPLHEFGIEAGYGINSYVTMSLKPFRGINWETTFRRREIGTNVGNIWQSSFSYQAKHADLKMNYLEDVQTAQNMLLNQVNGSQNVSQLPGPNQIPGQINVLLPTLSNDVFIRKRADAQISYKTGKSVISTQIYDERRFFQLGSYEQELKGISASWNWYFAHTMSFFVSTLLQKTQSTSIVTPSNVRKDFAIGLSRAIPVKIGTNGGMNAAFEYRHTNQDSELIGYNFDENRLTANLLIAF